MQNRQHMEKTLKKTPKSLFESVFNESYVPFEDLFNETYLGTKQVVSTTHVKSKESEPDDE